MTTASIVEKTQMIQVIERRRVDRRISERRRSTYINAYAVGIYRCDCCDYDAASRSDDINYHFTYLVHSIGRIFHQLVDCVMEAIFSLIGPDAPVASANLTAVVAPPTVRSSPLLPTAAQGTSKASKKNSRTHVSSTTGLKAHFSFLKNIDWKECIFENLHLASQALALVATLAGGVVFAATALTFAIFGKSETGDFHEAMERAYRQKAEEERQRREREEEEEDLEREKKEQRRRDDEDDDARKVQDEMERIDLHLKRDGFKHQNPNDEVSLRENDRKVMKLNYAADDVLDGKLDIDNFDKNVNEFRNYEEERTKQNEKEREDRKKEREQHEHYRKYLDARADACDFRKRAGDAKYAGDDRKSADLWASAESSKRKAEEHYIKSL
jgi:hypothetical protein